MVGRKDDEWPPGNGSPKTGSSTVMALDPSSAKPRSLGATFLPNAVLVESAASRPTDSKYRGCIYVIKATFFVGRCIYLPSNW